MTLVADAPTARAHRPRASRPVARRSPLLTVLVVLVVGVAPVEGYVLGVAPFLTKVAPAALVGVWALRLLRQGRLPRTHAVSWLALALLVAVMASCAVNTGNPYVVGYAVRWVPFLVLTVVLVDVLSTDVDARVALWATAGGALVAGVGALVSFFVLGSRRATGPLEDPNDLAYVLVAALPLALLVRSRTTGRWQGAVAGVAGVVLLAGAALTLSRGGALACGTLLVWALAHRLVSRRVAVRAVVAGAVLAGLALLLAGDAVSSALAQKTYIAGTNIATRELRWRAAAAELATHPWLGVGPGGTRHNYRAYSDNAEPAEATAVTHNMYVEVGAELGIIGLVLFVAIIATALVATTSVRRCDRLTALACQGSLLAALTASTFLSEEYYMALWGVVAAAAALQLGPRARSGPAPGAPGRRGALGRRGAPGDPGGRRALDVAGDPS